MDTFDTSHLLELNDKYALHFRHNSKIDEVEKIGITAALGEQSVSGDLFQSEKFPKACIATGQEGTLRIVNRFISASFGNTIGNLSSMIGYYANLPGEENPTEDKVDLTSKDMEYIFDPTRAEDVKAIFDIMEKFYKERTYYIIPEFNPVEYERDVTADDIESINASEEIKNLRENLEDIYIKLDTKGKDSKTSELEKEAFEKIKLLRKKSMSLLEEKQGAETKDGMYRIYEFDDAKRKLKQQPKHNIYTKIVENSEYGYSCIDISNDQIKRVTVDGKEASALDVIKELVRLKDKSLYYTAYPGQERMYEAPIVELFAAYTSIPETDIGSRQAMAEQIAKYYKVFNEKAGELKSQGIRATEKIAIEEMKKISIPMISDILDEKNVDGLTQVGIQKQAKKEDVVLERANANEEFGNFEKEVKKGNEGKEEESGEISVDD